MAFEVAQVSLFMLVLSLVLMAFGLYTLLRAIRLNKESYKCMKTFSIFLEDATKEFEALAENREHVVRVFLADKKTGNEENKS